MLKTAAILQFILAAAHILCMPWLNQAFQIYGIEDTMQQIASHGAALPYLLTVVIAGCFALCGLYALSAAGTIRRLPLLRLGIFFVAAIFLIIGLLYLLGGIHRFSREAHAGKK